MSLVCIAIGSNIGNRLENMRSAASILHEQENISIVSASRCYETAPVGDIEQPWFLNAAILLETSLRPEELLLLCLATESHLGRVRDPLNKNGPRVIDLDIVFYDDLILETSQLVLPHPAMIDRGFVLAPLVDIATEKKLTWRHPKLNRSILELYQDWEQVQAYDISESLVMGDYWLFLEDSSS